MQNKHHNLLTVGFIGRCYIEDVPKIKNAIEEIPNFKVVFFKTVSSNRLWLKIEELHG